jgi:putative transposase
VETIARLGAKLILQQTLESEVELFLGRARYERAEERVAYRNGYEPKTVETTSGPLELERPRPRGASELGFSSAVLIALPAARTSESTLLVTSTATRRPSSRSIITST